MQRSMPRRGLAGAMVPAALSLMIAGLPALAEGQDAGGVQPFVKIVPQGQIILNPEPGQDAPAAALEADEAHEALTALEPAAGGAIVAPPAPAAAACPDGDGDGWQVLVVRGGDRVETVRGRLIAVTPQGC